MKKRKELFKCLEDINGSKGLAFFINNKTTISINISHIHSVEDIIARLNIGDVEGHAIPMLPQVEILQRVWRRESDVAIRHVFPNHVTSQHQGGDIIGQHLHVDGVV
mgnify:CR=1 FL=1